MNMIDIILKKRDGGKLSKGEIEFFVEGYTAGRIPDYQASALLMAIFFNQLEKEEIVNLTDAMRRSGDIIDLSPIHGIKVDKHSTGGVGDKTTLIVAPLAAACGVPIAKMSGRGLGFTGGTVDKMESVPGLQTVLTPEAFIHKVNEIGIAVIGQTAQIAKADKLLYALRDVTGTVDIPGLIASSVMSKKLAAGSDAIVLDVKCGKGAFMHHKEDAVHLGQLMVDIGNAAGKSTVAVVTDMNQPLGYAVGNSLEVIEAIETLKGLGPTDITQLSIYLAGLMIYLGGRAASPEEGREQAASALETGSGLEKLKEFILSQGGDARVIEDYSHFPQAKAQQDVVSDKTGYVNQLDAGIIGSASQHSGAGRATKEEEIDLAAGIFLHKKIGDYVQAGEPLATVYGATPEKLISAAEECQAAYV
ncbi:MAG: pyrimidine-nucleoside phosphorylase, partial [Anaerovoracaceae bacterium]